MHNSERRDFDLLADHTKVKIVIVLTMSLDFLEHQYNVIMHLVRHSRNEPLFYHNVSFGQFF